MYTLSDRARDGEPARIGAHCGTSVNGTVNADEENDRNRPITVPRSARVPWDQQLRQSSHREVSLPAWVRTGLVLSDEDQKFCCVSRDRFYVPSLCISWDGQVVRCLKKRNRLREKVTSRVEGFQKVKTCHRHRSLCELRRVGWARSR
jgi:hypothetical protein